MTQIKIPTFTLSVYLLLVGEFAQECTAMETGETTPPATVSKNLEDYLTESPTDLDDKSPDFDSPALNPTTESNLGTNPAQPSAEAVTAESPKKLESPGNAEKLKITEPALGLPNADPKTEITEDKNTPDETPSASKSSTETKPVTTQLSPQLLELREQVRDCLGYYFNDYENVVDHSPWGVMHVLIAYGVDTQVYVNGSKSNAIGYLCWNGTCRGQELFYVNREKLEARIGPGVQGHDGQFLAMMAQSRVREEYPMRVEGRDFTLANLIDYEKRTCQAGTELTFKLIGLAHYLDTDATWKNQNGQDWSIPRLIKEELAQPIIGAACGGTHRLMGFNYAVRKREKEGKPIKGQYLRARKFLDDYFDYTFYLQNNDGSFSTDFFRGRNSYGDVNQRVETTGHILEWFVASLSNEQLRDPRVVKAVSCLTKLMLQNRTNNWEIGPKGHALHALAIYDERVFGDKPGSRSETLSRTKKKNVSDNSRR